MSDDRPTPREEQMRNDLETRGFNVTRIDTSGVAPHVLAEFEGTEKQARHSIPDEYIEEDLMGSADGPTLVALSVK